MKDRETCLTIYDYIHASPYTWGDLTDLFNSWLEDQQKNGKYPDLPSGGIRASELFEYRNSDVNSRKAHVGRAFLDFMNR